MEQSCTILQVLSMMKYYHLYNCTSYETSLCVWEREMEGEGERGVLCCINTNRKSLLKHVSTPASYTSTQSYDCHVEWIKLTCLYLEWFWSDWFGTEWHNVLHYYTLRFMFQNHWEQKYYIPRTQRAVTDQIVPGELLHPVITSHKGWFVGQVPPFLKLSITHCVDYTASDTHIIICWPPVNQRQS